MDEGQSAHQTAPRYSQPRGRWRRSGKAELAEILVVPLPRKPPTPLGYPHRKDHPAVLTNDAMEIKKGSVVRVFEAYGELLTLINAAVFRAPRSSRPKADHPRH